MPGPVYIGTAMVFSCSWYQYFFLENINFLNFYKNINFLNFYKNINFINILGPFDLMPGHHDVFLLPFTFIYFHKILPLLILTIDHRPGPHDVMLNSFTSIFMVSISF